MFQKYLYYKEYLFYLEVIAFQRILVLFGVYASQIILNNE